MQKPGFIRMNASIQPLFFNENSPKVTTFAYGISDYE